MVLVLNLDNNICFSKKETNVSSTLALDCTIQQNWELYKVNNQISVKTIHNIRLDSMLITEFYAKTSFIG